MRIILSILGRLNACWLAAIFCWLAAVPASAVVLNWSTVSWTAGSLSQSYDVDTTFAGDDISISVGGDTGRMETGFPVDDTGLTGGFGGSGESLRLRADFNKNDQALTVTIAFNYNTWLANGASNVSFTIFDIDTDNSYVDQIKSITASTIHGTTVGATLTGGADVTITGNGTVGATATGTDSQGANSSDGNLTINFGTNIITSLTFTYANDGSAAKNPNVQNVSLYNINFTKNAIPEVGTSWAVVAIFGAGLVLRKWRRLRNRDSA